MFLALAAAEVSNYLVKAGKHMQLSRPHLPGYHQTWLGGRSWWVFAHCKMHGLPCQNGAHGALRDPDSSWCRGSSQLRSLKLSTMYSFFLGPNCKAPEHAHFLLGEEEHSSCVGDVDIAGWAAYQRRWQVKETGTRGTWALLPPLNNEK